ncbi:MAG: 3-oxoacyl-[acyl-carrier-protein] synthase III C-terminal domain-containing protein [Bryobacteraceae bacterium]
MSATILSVTTAVPSHAVTTADVKEYFPKAFDLDPRRLASIHSVVGNACINKRHFVFPLDYTITSRPLEEITCQYKTHSIALGREVAESALAQAGLGARDIDLLITVSCTGIMIPSLDAYLINAMGFRADVKRLPITELGCAAGAAALARAADYLRAYPDANALVIAVELPSLTLQRNDPSLANLVSCALFGDGAAGAVLTGRPAPGLRITASHSHLIPDSLDAMGFDLKGSGLHIVLSRSVPQLVRDEILAVTDQFLARHQLSRSDLAFYLLHPGGQKLLRYVEEELQLTNHHTRSSWAVLAEYGNLSSATVLFVMQDFLAQPPPPAGSRGLLAAFGPGFSMEMVLLEWN